MNKGLVPVVTREATANGCCALLAADNAVLSGDRGPSLEGLTIPMSSSRVVGMVSVSGCDSPVVSSGIDQFLRPLKLLGGV